MGWTKAPADENICAVVTKSYEHVDDQEGSGNDANDGGDIDASKHVVDVGSLEAQTKPDAQAVA